MRNSYLKHLKAAANYGKDYWAKTLGPIICAVLAVNLAYYSGSAGVWWPTIFSAALCGFAVSWATSVAEARAQTKWAALLVKTLASGEDTTITVEHIHLERRGEQP